MKLKLFLSVLFAASLLTIHAQVGIGITLPEAELDITSSTRGLLLPRVTLTSLIVEAPVINPQGGGIPTSTIVYHNGANSIAAGFYYWDGSQWVLLTTGESSDWTIIGNAGTTPGTNFIGTTDAQDFVIRTNNTEKARMTSGGDLGIGIAIPTAKAHVVQTTAVDAIAIDHSGTAGNGMDIEQTDATNASSALWLRDSGTGRVINADALNTASTANVIESDNQGLGSAVAVFQSNTGASDQAVYIEQDGTGAISRGIDTYMGATNTAIGYSLFHDGTGTGALLNLGNAANAAAGLDLRHAGTGRGFYTELTNATNASTGTTIFHDGIGNGYFTSLTNVANASTGMDLRHAGTGRGNYLDLSNATNANTGSLIFHSGTGTGNYTELSNAANASSGSSIVHAGTGIGQTIAQTGTGTGQLVTLTNVTNNGTISSLNHDGLGRGQQISLNNAANADIGLGVFHSGADGTAGYFEMSNTLATRNSVGLSVSYAGNGGGAGGGGNAGEFSHTGTNGNAVDIFLGDPSAAAGPANTTSEYVGVTVAHMATGTSPTAGLTKSAISASNNSADPTITVNNGGADDGDGMQIFTTPTANTNTTGIYTQSVNGALGTGIYAVGGDIGVVGQSNGGVSGVFAFGEVGATGAKPFTIDYPLDPENKVLRHFAIESNEVLNMYRGIAKVGSSGSIVVTLPEYFDAVNINVTYQLTPIGTGVQPYISKEQANNQFTISGAPNSKVSWTIHAQRNDPTLQYYDRKGGNYSSAVRNKKPHEIGKYYTPEAYGKDKSKSIIYNKEREKNYNERDITRKNLKVISKKEMKDGTSIENITQKKSEKEIEKSKTIEKPSKKKLSKEETTEK